VVPAILAAAWVASALLLLVLHVYRPIPATVLGLGLGLALARPAIRVTRSAAASFGDVPWWVLIGVLAIVAIFGALTFAHSAEDVLVRRDPGSYAMSASWLSGHGTIQMPIHAQLFGAPNQHLVLASQGFYRQGSHAIPQFMTGVPALLAVGGWIDGLAGVLHGNAVLSMLALLAFAGLALRLIGPRWTPLAVLVLALVQPELDVARAAYSEPAAQLLLLGGLAIVIDALIAGHLLPGRVPTAGTNPVARIVAERGLFVGGLVLGLVSVVRIDAVADLFPLVPLIGWLAYHRAHGWRRLASGMLLGLALGAFDCVVLTLPYAKHLGTDLKLVAFGFAVLVPATLAGLLVARWWDHRTARLAELPSIEPDSVLEPAKRSSIRRVCTRLDRFALRTVTFVRPSFIRWRAAGAAAGVLLIGIFFAIRPHLMTMRWNPNSGGANYVVQVQRFQGMAEDATRSYYENAAIWLSWYVGWATLALALLGACLLAFGQVAGRRRVWVPSFLVFFFTTALVLLKPSITSDHPWADRRFVPVALPGVVLFAVAATAMLVEGLRRSWPRTSWRAGGLAVARGALGAALVALIVVPTWFGSKDVLYSKTEVGEPALVRTVCAALRPGDVVLAVGNRAKAEWPGTLRVMCGVDAGYLDGADDAAGMAAVAAQATADGGRLMLLVESVSDKQAAQSEAAWPDQPTGFLRTAESAHTLVKRPGKPTPFDTTMWLGPYLPR
jgi:hypothetical protein